MPHIWDRSPQDGQSTPGDFVHRGWRMFPLAGVLTSLGDNDFTLSALDVAFGGP
jgi:hypothetical protein